MKQNWIAYVMIAPFMILFFVLTVVPIGLTLLVSLTNFNLLQWPDWVGFDNYIQLFLNDELFIKALSNTLIFAVAVGPASYLLSFVVAWFINEIPPKARALVTLIFYAPSISGGAYTIFTTLFSSDAYGWANAWLLKLGIIDEPILWLADTDYIMPICIMVALWMSLGTAFLSFIAGLQGLDRSQFEAAAVDGVTNRWQELWYVTLPNMKPQLMFGAVMAITSSFGFGDVVTNLTGSSTGGTDYAAYTLTHHVSEYGDTRWEVGYASAINFVLFLLMISANMLINKMLSKVGT
jgi:multiple sugar transport system permease protein